MPPRPTRSGLLLGVPVGVALVVVLARMVGGAAFRRRSRDGGLVRLDYRGRRWRWRFVAARLALGSARRLLLGAAGGGRLSLGAVGRLLLPGGLSLASVGGGGDGWRLRGDGRSGDRRRGRGCRDRYRGRGRRRLRDRGGLSRSVLLRRSARSGLGGTGRWSRRQPPRSGQVRGRTVGPLAGTRGTVVACGSREAGGRRNTGRRDGVRVIDPARLVRETRKRRRGKQGPTLLRDHRHQPKAHRRGDPQQGEGCAAHPFQQAGTGEAQPSRGP